MVNLTDADEEHIFSLSIGYPLLHIIIKVSLHSFHTGKNETKPEPDSIFSFSN